MCSYSECCCDIVVILSSILINLYLIARGRKKLKLICYCNKLLTKFLDQYGSMTRKRNRDISGEKQQQFCDFYALVNPWTTTA